MKQKKSKKIKNIPYKIISVLLTISSVIFIGLLFYANLLPTKYFVTVFLIVFIFDLLNIFLINMKKLKKKIKKILSVVMIFVTLIMCFISFYIYKTLNILNSNIDSKYKLENYSVIVLKDSPYEKIKDVDNDKIGYFKNSNGIKEATNKLNKVVNSSFEAYESSDSLVQDLLNSKINVILLEDSVKGIMEEEMENFASTTRVIYTFKVKTKVESTLKEVDVTKKPFAIYISGIDTYGEITSVSRSDVNMVMIVNPTIHQVLLISIPRDYYVQLHGTTGNKDKLTHAGIYGIDMSIQTIEDLLDIDINYYVKVNFTSVIDIVNALGGLDVYSEYTFTSYSGYRFKEGLNSVDGEQALDFARTRKAFKDGDRQRGKNQQAVIEAIIRKVSNKSIIMKYNSLLNAINGKYQTNMSMKKITSLIKMQLNNMSSWNVTSYSLTGTDSNNYTYTYNQLLYVMEPDENSIIEVKNLISNVLQGDKLEASYKNTSGNSNKVTKTYTNSSTSNDKKNNSDNNLNSQQKLNEEKNQEEVKKEVQSEQQKNDIDPEQEVKNEVDDEEQNNSESNSENTLSGDDVDPLNPIIPNPEQGEQDINME